MGRLRIAAVLAAALTVLLAAPASGAVRLDPLGSWADGGDLGPFVEGVAATEDGSIAAADRKRDRIVVFSHARERLGGFAAKDPRGIAAVPGGGYLVAEPGAVRRVDAAGRTLASYPATDPRGVALAGDTVLIADARRHRVLRYESDGSPLAPLDEWFLAPRGVAVAPEGDVYVVDAGLWRIERFAAGGEPAGGWQVPFADGVAVGPDGTVFVTADTLRWYSAAGTPAGAIAFGLRWPRGVAVDCRGTVTVADNSALRLSAFGDPGAPPPPCTPPPAPQPPPPRPPAPVRQPSPPAPEQPQLGRTAAATPVAGDVFVGTGAERRRLMERTIVPVETQVDATDGRVELSFETAPEDGVELGPYQSGVFRAGAFTIHQGRRNSLVELRLTGALAADDGEAQATRRRKRRRVWGSGKGRFRTTGRHGAATVRGTRWLTEDRPDGTFFKVTEGRVLAEAFERGERRLLEAGESFLARPACASRRRFRIRLRVPVGTPVRSVRVEVGGRRVAVRKGRRITAPVDLRGRPRGVVKVRIRVVTRAGTVLTGTRRYRTCVGPGGDVGSGVPEL